MSKLIILLLITIVNMLHVHNTQRLGNNLIMAILQIPHHSVVDKLDGYHQNSKTLGCEQLEEYQCIDNIARLLLLFVVPWLRNCTLQDIKKATENYTKQMTDKWDKFVDCSSSGGDFIAHFSFYLLTTWEKKFLDVSATNHTQFQFW
jgi:hypothetical protein